MLALTPSRSDNPVRVLRTRSEVEELREFWNSCRVRDADLEFFLFIVDLYPEAVRPHVVVTYRNGSPQALLLGRLEEKPMEFRVGYSRFKTNKIRVLTFIHGGIVGGAVDHDAVCLVESIRSSLRSGEAEVACFESLDVSGPLFVRSLDSSGFLTRRLLDNNRHYSRILDVGSKTFLESLTSNERNNHKRRTRKLFDSHKERIRIECFRKPSEVDRLMRDAETVTSKSYQRGLGVGFCLTLQTRERFDFEASRGWLRGYVLYIGEEPAAYWIGSLYRGTFYSGYMAYDPVQAKTAPGTYLTVEVLRDLSVSNAHEPAVNVDFGPGEAEYKARFGNRSQVLAKVFMFAPRFRGRLLHVLWVFSLAINFAGRRILPWMTVAARLKQYSRRRHGRNRKWTSDGANSRRFSTLQRSPPSRPSSRP
jgi:hypothetical protein